MDWNHGFNVTRTRKLNYIKGWWAITYRHTQCLHKSTYGYYYQLFWRVHTIVFTGSWFVIMYLLLLLCTCLSWVKWAFTSYSPVLIIMYSYMNSIILKCTLLTGILIYHHAYNIGDGHEYMYIYIVVIVVIFMLCHNMFVKIQNQSKYFICSDTPTQRGECCWFLKFSVYKRSNT